MKVKKSLVAVVAVASLGVGAVAAPSVASAMTTTSSTSASSTNTKSPAHHLSRQERRRLRREVVTISAKTIGISPQELVSQYKAGQSIADIARAHSVDSQKVVDALVQAGDARIDKAVANHRLSPSQAATLKAKVPTFAQKAVDRHRHAS